MCVVSTLAVFENVFDISVFVNSMTMHFQNNLYTLFMTMPNIKKMFYILYVQKLKSTSFFLCFRVTLGLKDYSPIIVSILPQSHRTASWSAQNSCERIRKWIVVSVWFGKTSGLFMYVYLVHGPWNIIYFVTLKSCEESNLRILHSHQKLNGGTK